MKKIILLLVFLLFTSCTYFNKENAQPVIKQECNCSNMGYVPIEDANKLIDLTNKLVDVANVCFSDKNLTPLPKLAYWEDKR